MNTKEILAWKLSEIEPGISDDPWCCKLFLFCCRSFGSYECSENGKDEENRNQTKRQTSRLILIKIFIEFK